MEQKDKYFDWILEQISSVELYDMIAVKADDYDIMSDGYDEPYMIYSTYNGRSLHFDSYQISKYMESPEEFISLLIKNLR